MELVRPQGGDFAQAARLLSEIAYTLESTEGAPARIRRALELLRKLVPCTRCALLQRAPGTPELLVLPEEAPGEVAPLASRLGGLFEALSEETGQGPLPAAPPGPDASAPPAPLRHAHVALPVTGGDALLGLLHLEDASAAAYDEQAMRLVSVVAAQLGGYLASLHARERDALRTRELEQRHQELLRLNRELEDSYRGILTLHTELEDRAESLRRAADVKGRLVANISHEYRTPLHSILGMTQLLADGADGPLTSEQQKQVRYIRSSAEELLQLIDDLLDLTKLEGGKLSLRAERFTLPDFLASMRGSLRPLVPQGAPVRLVFDEPTPALALDTDKGKLSQVVRNLVSNALKFTERGEVRLCASQAADGQVVLSVRDTGIGISPENLERIFEEFGQVDSHLQARVKGTGLGLPLSRKLMEVLGGTLTVQSEPGRGSTFTLTFPALHPEVREMQAITDRGTRPTPPGLAPVLVVEDDRKAVFIYEKYLSMAGFHVIAVRSVEEARRAMRERPPAAIVLDIMLEGETSWQFLADVKHDPETHDIPVLVVTVTDERERARALGADEFWLKPIDQERLLKKLKSLVKVSTPARVLVIDDDEQARYIVRKHLEKTPYAILEAGAGPEGVRLARTEHPHVILLDFLLQDMTAFDVLDELKADPRTRTIPVIVVTSHLLDAAEKSRLLEEAEAVISKQALSRELAINRIRDALRKAGVRSSNVA